MAVQTSEAVGGVIITASHNPQPWNALKFLEGRGLFLTAAQNAEVRRRYDDQSGHVAWDRLGASLRPRGCGGRSPGRAAGAALARPRPHRPPRPHGRGRRGGGRFGAPSRRGCWTRSASPASRCTAGCTGLFPHEPEPTPAHLTELAAVVRETGADVGFALDPDGDRLALVAPGGVALSEEMTLVLALDFVLAREPGAVAVNLSTTRLIEDVAARHGARVLRTPVGEANVVETMLRELCVIGGEGNGGVIYPALHPGRDGLVGMAMILQLLAERGVSLAELAGQLPPAVMVKDKVPAASLPDGKDLVARLRALGPGTIDERDGLKWTGDGAWVHVRPSNTEPIVRIIAEAASADAARELIAKVRAAGAGA